MCDIHDVDVLLVEDSPRDAELTIRALRKGRLANRVVHVVDGQAALDWLFTSARDGTCQHPRLILLDLKLPKVDGLDVLRAIRGDERTHHLPVVLLTSSAEERDVVASYDLGVNSYVVKPVEFDSFSSAVTELGHYWLLVNQPPQ